MKVVRISGIRLSIFHLINQKRMIRFQRKQELSTKMCSVCLIRLTRFMKKWGRKRSAIALTNSSLDTTTKKWTDRKVWKKVRKKALRRKILTSKSMKRRRKETIEAKEVEKSRCQGILMKIISQLHLSIEARRFRLGFPSPSSYNVLNLRLILIPQLWPTTNNKSEEGLPA